MTAIYHDIMELLSSRMVSKVDVMAPLYICSIGAHIFNGVNKTSRVLTEGALIADSRIHVIMITVPGFGKSFMLKQFLEKEIGICWGTKIHPTWVASMTTAAFIGSIKMDKDGQPMVTRGICERFKKSIVGIHEFAGITNSMALSYNVELNDALLLALDDGSVRKNVATGEIEFTTELTLFSAVQPARYNLTSGLGRRLCFLVYIPTLEDVERLRKTRRRSRYVVDNKKLLNKIREEIDQKHEDIKKIQKITFTDKLYDWLEKNKVIPYEEVLYERIGIGYAIMTQSIKDELVVDLDDELERIFIQQHQDRMSIKEGVDTQQVWRFIREEKEILKETLYQTLMEFSLDRRSIHSRLRTLEVLGYIKDQGDKYLITHKEEI